MDATEVRNQMSQSSFLKGADLGSNVELKVKISQVEKGSQKQNGKEIPQLMLHFEGKEKKLGLNMSNLDSIIAMFGANTDDWVGKTVILFTLPVQNPQGQMTIGIRIKGETIQTEQSNEF
jgi:hypothetical protein